MLHLLLHLLLLAVVFFRYVSSASNKKGRSLTLLFPLVLCLHAVDEKYLRRKDFSWQPIRLTSDKSAFRRSYLPVHCKQGWFDVERIRSNSDGTEGHRIKYEQRSNCNVSLVTCKIRVIGLQPVVC